MTLSEDLEERQRLYDQGRAIQDWNESISAANIFWERLDAQINILIGGVIAIAVPFWIAPVGAFAGVATAMSFANGVALITVAGIEMLEGQPHEDGLNLAYSLTSGPIPLWFGLFGGVTSLFAGTTALESMEASVRIGEDVTLIADVLELRKSISSPNRNENMALALQVGNGLFSILSRTASQTEKKASVVSLPPPAIPLSLPSAAERRSLERQLFGVPSRFAIPTIWKVKKDMLDRTLRNIKANKGLTQQEQEKRINRANEDAIGWLYPNAAIPAYLGGSGLDPEDEVSSSFRDIDQFPLP